jgi:hypothetical protein
MNTLFTYLLLLLSLLTLPSLTTEPPTQQPILKLPPTECSAPIRNSCAFYTLCLENRAYDCGPTGYPLAYGQHYCDAFAAVNSSFSPRGQQWMSNTMRCLQTALIPEATGATGAVAGCDALRDKAFGTHAKCYVASGLCTLSVRDWRVIVRTVGVGNLVSSGDAVKATLGAAGDCLGIYAKEVIGRFK